MIGQCNCIMCKPIDFLPKVADNQISTTTHSMSPPSCLLYRSGHMSWLAKVDPIQPVQSCIGVRLKFKAGLRLPYSFFPAQECRIRAVLLRPSLWRINNQLLFDLGVFRQTLIKSQIYTTTLLPLGHIHCNHSTIINLSILQKPE